MTDKNEKEIELETGNFEELVILMLQDIKDRLDEIENETDQN